MADVNFPCSPVPDCFQESECNPDCFDDISAEAFDYATTDDFFTDKAAPPQDVTAQPLASSNPSDVSTDGSGCVEMPSSEAGDEGGSLASVVCLEPDGLGSSMQFACSGESVNGSTEELPEDTVASSAKQQFVLVRLDDNGRYMRTANEDDMRLLMKLLNAPESAHVHPEGNEASVASEDDETLPVRAAPASAPSTSHSGGHRKPGGPCCHCGATESPQWRRGPAIKPVLCNACGTRFRRTNQLGVAIPSYLKDKSRGAASCKRRPQKEAAEAPDVPAHASKRHASSRSSSARQSDAAVAAA